MPPTSGNFFKTVYDSDNIEEDEYIQRMRIRLCHQYFVQAIEDAFMNSVLIRNNQYWHMFTQNMKHFSICSSQRRQNIQDHSDRFKFSEACEKCNRFLRMCRVHDRACNKQRGECKVPRCRNSEKLNLFVHPRTNPFSGPLLANRETPLERSRNEAKLLMAKEINQLYLMQSHGLITADEVARQEHKSGMVFIDFHVV